MSFRPNKLIVQIEYIEYLLDEAQEEAERINSKIANAKNALRELLDEDGPYFMRVRCLSCRSSWLDQRETPTVTKCPSCGKNQ